MDDTPILGRDDARDLARQVLAQHGAPAYVRRAVQVEEAYVQLISRCRRQRDEWLRMVRVRLGLLHALAGDWSVLRPCLAGEEHLHALQQLYADLDPRLRLRVEPSSSVRKLRRALEALRDSIVFFNRRWEAFLPTVDLAPLNELRDGYNRYYVLEKECAVRSVSVARQGFRTLPTLTVEDIARVLPTLPELK